MEKVTLKRKATAGALFLGIKRIIVQAIYTISNIFLARLLFPADFGTFAIVTFVITFVAVFTDLGLGPSLVQKKDQITKEDLQTVFTFQLLLSFAAVLIIFSASPIISSFYRLGDKGILLFRLYSLYLLFVPFRTASGAILERNLDYSKLVIIEVFQIAISTAITVAAAFLGFGVFSFVWGTVIGHLVASAVYFGFSPWEVGLAIVKKNLLVLAKFGLPFQSQAWLGLLYGPAILLYLGRIVGPANLGFYSWAAGLAALPMAVPEIVNRIIFPLGARSQEDKKFFQQTIERSIMVVSATSLPVIFILMAAAPAIIHFIYTDRWLPALPVLYLGLLQMGIIGLTGIFGQSLLALGKAGVMRNISIVWAVLTWIVAPPLIHFFNFVGMSLAGLAVSATGIWLLFRLRKEIGFSFLTNFLPYFVSAAIASFIVGVLIKTLSTAFLNLVIALVIGVFIYLISALFLRRREIVGMAESFVSLLKTG